MRAYKFKLRLQKNLIRLLLSFVLSVAITIGYILLNAPIKEKLSEINSEPSFEFSVEAKNPPTQVLGESSPMRFEMQTNEYSYRARVLDLYFKKYDSPLYGYGQNFVDACEKYGAPEHCTLLPAIAKVETDLCKTGISHAQYNCWGFGGSGENRFAYKSFEQSIDVVTARIMQGYGKGFFNNPNTGELAYCGDHCSGWGEHVQGAQSEIRGIAKANEYVM